jgi:DNA topoisomerase-1
MPPTFDLRTYAKLEAALIRHLVKDWKQRSAPIFADIATACRNRQWNEARRRVPELDLHEVGAENKEWIKYHLHSFAVFGAGCVAKQRPSFVGVGTFDTTLNQVAQNVVTYLELTATSQVQTQTLQLIAEDEAMATAPVKVAYDPAQPRDASGKWTGTATFTATEDIPEYPGRELSDHISKIQDAPIVQIETSEDRVDEGTVAVMMRAMQAGEGLPALVVEFSGDTPDGTGDMVTVIDGHNRLKAAKRLGMSIVPVRVRVADDDWSTVKAAGGMAIRVATAQLKVAKDTRWDESQHPRNPAGSDAGGEFTTVIKEGMRAYAKKDSDRLKALGVPPDWTDVQVSINPNAGLQATGKDAKGRTQYWYSAEHDEKAAAEKFERVKEFASVADKVSAQTLKDLESDDPEVREAAAALYVIEKTAFRIGSNAETKADKKAYGVTTLLGKHVRVLEGGRVSFRFPGKSGVLNAKIIKDPVLHKMMSERKGGSDAPLFDTSGDKVRDYMDRTAPGFHPKDYRTHQGTAIALLEIDKRKKVKTEKEFKHAQKMVAKVVAAHLGNTPTVAIESYINPAVWGRLRA